MKIVVVNFMVNVWIEQGVNVGWVDRYDLHGALLYQKGGVFFRVR